MQANQSINIKVHLCSRPMGLYFIASHLWGTQRLHDHCSWASVVTFSFQSLLQLGVDFDHCSFTIYRRSCFSFRTRTCFSCSWVSVVTFSFLHRRYSSSSFTPNNPWISKTIQNPCNQTHPIILSSELLSLNFLNLDGLYLMKIRIFIKPKSCWSLFFWLKAE